MRHTKSRERIAFLTRIVLAVLLGVGMAVLIPTPTPAIRSKGFISISSLSPSSATMGDPGFTLTVNGANFANGTACFFNSNLRPTTVVSASQLLVSILASDLAQAGTFSVTVSNASTRKTVSAPFVVKPGYTDTELTSSTNPSNPGDVVTFIATVTAPAGTPTGTVVFMDSLNVIGSNVLSDGLATFTTSLLSTGTHWICAAYGGDSNCRPSTNSPALPQIVGVPSPMIDTLTIVNSTANPAVFGQLLVFTANIKSSQIGAGPPTGAAAFEESGVPLGFGFLNNYGQAMLPISPLPVGTNFISAVYAGDACFSASTSGTLTQAIVVARTAVAVSSSANPSVFGQSVIFSALVNPVPPGSGVPTGILTYQDGTNVIGSVPLSSGRGTFTTSAPGVGTHSIVVAYSGDGNFGASASLVLSQTVGQDNSTTSLVSSANPSSRGQPVTFTATVIAVAPGSGTPTGTVTIMDGNKSLVTTAIVNGQATYTTTTLNPAPHSITAVYSGDTNFYGSTSGTVNQAVN